MGRCLTIRPVEVALRLALASLRRRLLKGHLPWRSQVLGELQDRLAPFSSAVAYALIEEELGQPVSAVFEHLSHEPVAAASLGQARCKTDAACAS